METTASQFKYPDECFFIAPIGDEKTPIRERSDDVMKYIVKPAVESLGLSVARADTLGHPGQINLQVIDHVIGARAAVADLTGLNPNVFYEVGLRHAAKLPLVLIANKETKLPFDLLNLRTVFFDHTKLSDADWCRQQIIEHLDQSLNHGIVDSPVSVSTDLNRLSSGGALDRTVAELVSTVAGLSSNQLTLGGVIAEFLNAQSDEAKSKVISPALINQLEIDAYDFATNHHLNDEQNEAFRKIRGLIKALAEHTSWENYNRLKDDVEGQAQ